MRNETHNIGMKNRIEFIHVYDKEDMLVPIGNVLAIEASGHYSRIFFKNIEHIGSLSPRTSFNKLTKEIPDYFLKISRFQIINTNEVTLLTANRIKFKNGLEIRLKGKNTYENFVFNTRM